MLAKIISFLKDSVVYSISSAAFKGMGIITLPIYSKFLSLQEFGLFGILDPTITILAELLTAGQTNSILFFGKRSEDGNRSKSIFFTIAASVLAINFLFLLAGLLFGEQIFNSFEWGKEFIDFLSLIIFISVFRALNNLFLNKLRADDKAYLFTLITLIKIIVFVSLIILFVSLQKLGVFGIMYSYLISEALILILLFIPMIKNMQFKFDSEIAADSIKFGFPLIFGTIGIMILNLSDRYLLNYFLDRSAVGLYDFGYRIAGAVNMFLIMPFNLTLLPAAYKMYKQPGDKRYYSKIMTYLCFMTVWAGLALSLFSEEIVRLFALNPDYNSAFVVVPILILAYIFSAMRNVASIGLMVTKKTMQVAFLTIGAAAINIILNIYLIPMFGMIAAAYTTLFSFVVFHFITKAFADKYYSITYEKRKLFILFGLGVMIFLLINFLPSGISISAIFIKLAAIVFFPYILFLFNFYEPIELQTMKNIFSKGTSFNRIKEQINQLLTFKKHE